MKEKHLPPNDSFGTSAKPKPKPRFQSVDPIPHRGRHRAKMLDGTLDPGPTTLTREEYRRLYANRGVPQEQEGVGSDRGDVEAGVANGH